MTLKKIFQDFCENLNEVECMSKTFGDLGTDEERFTFTRKLFQDYASGLHFGKTGKNASLSRQVREKGNYYFKKNNLWEALKYYSQSIALAENNSEELALSLGNRSACLLRLKLPKESILDVEEVLSKPIRSEYREKILKRKESCLSLIRDDDLNIIDFGGEGIPSVRSKSTYFDSASSAVKLMTNENLGRHLVAGETVKSGEILVVEKPYSSILLPDYFYSHCANCLRRCSRLIPCTNCSTSMFCSNKCLTDSLKINHKVECFVLETLVNLKAWRMELLSLRILLNASRQGSHLKNLAKEVSEINMNNNAEATYHSLDHASIYNLVGNTEKRTVADLFYRSVKASILVLILERCSDFFIENEDETLKQFSGGLLLRYLQSLPCNAHEVSEFCEEGLIEIGAGAYATLSLINHSCEPNVVRFSYGDVVTLIAIRPIKAGEEIVDNYGYHYATHPRCERQNSLLKQYYFTCQCEACVEKWPLYEKIPDKTPNFKTSVNKDVYESLTNTFKSNLEDVFNGDFTDNTLQSFYHYLDFLDQHVQRPWRSYNKCQEAIKHCLSFNANHFRFSKGLPNHSK